MYQTFLKNFQDQGMALEDNETSILEFLEDDQLPNFGKLYYLLINFQMILQVFWAITILFPFPLFLPLLMQMGNCLEHVLNVMDKSSSNLMVNKHFSAAPMQVFAVGQWVRRTIIAGSQQVS